MYCFIIHVRVLVLIVIVLLPGSRVATTNKCTLLCQYVYLYTLLPLIEVPVSFWARQTCDNIILLIIVYYWCRTVLLYIGIYLEGHEFFVMSAKKTYR